MQPQVILTQLQIDIPKYQVSMLVKRGDTIIYQGVNSYSMNALKISNFMFDLYGVNGASKKFQWVDQPSLTS